LQQEDQTAVPDVETAEEEIPGGRRGSITSRPFKPSAKRTKSWDLRDKRGELQMSVMRDGGVEGPKDGFSEA